MIRLKGLLFTQGANQTGITSQLGKAYRKIGSEGHHRDSRKLGDLFIDPELEGGL